jgi:hypothetical protein
MLLSYSPTIRVREPYDAYRRTEAHQTEFFYLQWFREGRPRPYLAQSLSFGTVDWATLYAPGESPTAALPGMAVPGGAIAGTTPVTTQPTLSSVRRPGTFDELLLDSTGGISWPLTKLSMLDTALGFTYGGGTDFASRTIAPLMTLGRGRAQLDMTLDAVDTVIARADVTAVQFQLGPTVLSTFGEVDLSGRWRRRLSPIVSLEGAFGGATIRGWPGGSPKAIWSVVPVAQAQLSTHFAKGPHTVSFDATAGAAPFVDRFAAQMYERLDAAGTMLYAFREVWQLGLRGGVGQSLQPLTAGNLTTTFVEARLGYVPPRIWRIDVSGANSAVVYAGALVNTWVVGLAVAFRAEGMF